MKSFKIHLKRLVGESKLDFEKMVTILTQIEASSNSRPLGTVPHDNDDGIEMLTPCRHFLIGRPLQSIQIIIPNPLNPSVLYEGSTFVRHFWERWRNEYIVALRNHSKWKFATENFQVGDIVVVKKDDLFSSRWPIALVVETNAGTDGLTHVVTLKTKDGTY